MMKKFIFCIGFVMTASMFSSAYSQNPSVSSDKIELSSIRPADGKPYSFPTEEIKNRVVPQKIAELRILIAQDIEIPSRVQIYRELIWRYENAIISPYTGKN